MINILVAILFGFVQGVTEFLPVSSSGHLLVLHEFFNLPIRSKLAFDVALHWATFFAVFLYFFQDIIRITRSFLKTFFKQKDEDAALGWKIILATVPAAVIGLLFENAIENKLRSVSVVIVMLIVVAILFMFFEKIRNRQNDLSDLSWKKALVIGFSQSLALIPGTSRSGITIIAGLASGLKREAAVRFSFLLMLPIVFGAGLTKLPELFNADLEKVEVIVLLASFFTALISGWLTIRYILRFVKNNTLIPFAWYRIVLAAILLILFL